MTAQRIAVLLFFNLVLGALLYANLQPITNYFAMALLVFVNLFFAWFIRNLYKVTVGAIRLPSEAVQVKLIANVLHTTVAPTAWQTAHIIFKGSASSEEVPDLEVEIGMSSMGIPNLSGLFDALVFFKDQKPVLIVKEDQTFLATISGVQVDRRKSS